ncbi:hypothetical protein BU25DRAFT_406116 [Macroventuria anomochaeta]|uniref:Uncharacterized protein n=1 Tax=Macroventuria anomochaeta TaxID=301207 RepID=A0ACB6SHN4_9PLEO|nr:uncharacterized protein BU25DRAFT_406116 [Macroventuria anomochaeta]KAF2632804.1 hypothetical protein BU25DRAFT_406116 [Macroventuria anomochaeta]
MLHWIWDTAFAAVGGDSLSFEIYLPRKEYGGNGTLEKVLGLFMHEVLLAGWGMPIGKLGRTQQILQRKGQMGFLPVKCPL